MKSFILLILFILIALSGVFNTSVAGEVTGAGQRVKEVLRANNTSIENLQSSGLRVLLGEVTGAGRAVNVLDVKMFIAKKRLLKMDNVLHIDFREGTPAKTILDIKSIDLGEISVLTKDVDAWIID